MVNEDTFFQLLFTAVVIFGGGWLITNVFQPQPDDPKSIWFNDKSDKCWAMGGRIYRSNNNTHIECYRRVFFSKEPRLLFSEDWAEPTVSPSKGS